jgi:hypothetical protein
MRIGTALTLMLVSAATSAALDGGEILKKMDVNRTWRSIVSKATMEIIVNAERRVKTMDIAGLSEGNRSLVRFTNPEDDGTAYLMIGGDLWIYFPEENDVVKISGHLLKEGMMGSDVSYEDALEADRLADKYDIALSGEETLHGNDCWKVTLSAKVNNAPYDRRIMWVEKQRYIAWKEESYAKSGRLLKTATVLDVKRIGDRWYPVRVEMASALRKNSRTVFTTDSVAINAPLDEGMFTMRNLRR